MDSRWCSPRQRVHRPLLLDNLEIGTILDTAPYSNGDGRVSQREIKKNEYDDCPILCHCCCCSWRGWSTLFFSSSPSAISARKFRAFFIFSTVARPPWSRVTLPPPVQRDEGGGIEGDEVRRRKPRRRSRKRKRRKGAGHNFFSNGHSS